MRFSPSPGARSFAGRSWVHNEKAAVVTPAMRILYFSADYGPHDHRFLSALARTRHDVYFLRLAQGSRQVEDRPIPARIQQLRLRGGGSTFRWSALPFLVLDLKRILRELKPDLIHAGPIQTCAFLAALSGFRPLLTMSWGFDLMQDADRDAWWRWVTRYTLRRSTFFVSDARVTRARAIALGMRADRTAVFPWGVDLAQFRPARTARPAVRSRRASAKRSRRGGHAVGTAEPLVLLCNRSWEPRYGVDVLATAFVVAARQYRGLSLILMGGGSQGGAIRRILEDGGQMHRVQFAGQVRYTDLPRWYHMADLFVSPSHVDGSSVSLMEALASGTPVLVSDIPANKEWVRHGVNGWLFRDGVAEALSDRILWLCSHRAELGRVGRAARQVAEARADWNRNFGKLLRAYDLAVTAGPGGG